MVIVLAMAIATIASLVHMRVKARAAGEQIHLGPGEAQLGPDGHYHIVDALGHSFARPLRMETTEIGTISVVDAVGQTADPAQFARDELVEVAREDL